jgi:hypothetical protein
MKTLIALVLVVSCVVIGRAQQGPQGTAPEPHFLMPVPASVQFKPGRLLLTAPFTVAVRGHTDARLQGAIDRAVRRIEGRTLVAYPRGLATDAAAATLVVECKGPGLAVPAVTEDETYTLDVSDRQAVLTAPTVRGHQAQPRRHGRGQAQRAPLAPDGGPGVPRREP